MSFDPREQTACAGKTAFLTWEHAKKGMARGRFSDRRSYGEMGVYRCRFCRSWHLGRSSMRRRPA